MECITCALCIDACDNVMDKIGEPEDLISYSTLRDYNHNLALVRDNSGAIRPYLVRDAAGAFHQYCATFQLAHLLASSHFALYRNLGRHWDGHALLPADAGPPAG